MNELIWLRQILTPGTDVAKLTHQQLVEAVKFAYEFWPSSMPKQPYGYTYSMLADKIKRLAEEEKKHAG